MENTEHPEYTVVTQNAGNILSSSMMAPIDLPHNVDIQAFKACYYDRSPQTNFPDCSMIFTFYRVPDDGCPVGGGFLTGEMMIEKGNCHMTNFALSL